MNTNTELREMSDEQLEATAARGGPHAVSFAFSIAVERLNTPSEIQKEPPHDRSDQNDPDRASEGGPLTGFAVNQIFQLTTPPTRLMPKRVVSGIVTSDKMSKTRRVEINRLVKHPKYKKYIRQRTVCYAHDDEQNESGAGDRVEIIESEPLSKLKRWRLVRVLEKSTEVDLAALRAARKGATQAESEAIEAAHAGEETPADESPAES